MARCPNCNSEHSHDELKLTKSYSTETTNYAILRCPSCGKEADYTEWDAFYALYD